MPETPVTVVKELFWTCETRGASVAAVAPPNVVNLKPPSVIFPVGVVCPSFVKQLVRPFVAMSVSVLFAQVLEMVVPVTTGLPAIRVNVPEPLNAICHLHDHAR